ILRALIETLEDAPRPLVEGLQTHYRRVIESQNAFAIPLAFNDALVGLLEAEPDRDVILMLDEFDAVLSGLDERVFLNLRALKDKYAVQLNYIIATLNPPSSFEGGDDLSEFLEPFAAYKHYLAPLTP